MKGFFFVMKTAVMTAALSYAFLRVFKQMDHADVMTTAGVLSTVSGILFGFVLAAISIFSSASGNDNGIIDALKKNNILPVIISKLLSTGVTLILSCIFSLIAMFLPSEKQYLNTDLDFLFIIIGLSLLVISIYTFSSCWRKLTWIFPYM